MKLLKNIYSYINDILKESMLMTSESMLIVFSFNLIVILEPSIFTSLLSKLLKDCFNFLISVRIDSPMKNCNCKKKCFTIENASKKWLETSVLNEDVKSMIKKFQKFRKEMIRENSTIVDVILRSCVARILSLAFLHSFT